MKAEADIKNVSKADIDLIVNLASEIWPATYRDILSEAQIAYMMNLFYTPAAIHQQMTEKNHRFLVAAIAGSPVAFASYGLMDGRKLKLHKIYVHQKMQGKGIGRLMIEFIMKQMKKEDVNLLELNVNRNNKARWFYEKLGFTIIKEENIDIGSGFLMEDYVMRLKV